ncbi:MAG: hypothetical protein ACO3UW_08555, partial [Candidatus Nanopelagicales bacterium]
MRGQSRSRLHAVTEAHDVVGAPASCLAEGAVAPNQGAIHHILSEADHGPATRACFRLQDAKGLTSPDVAVLHLHLGAGPTGIDLAAGMRQRQPSVGLVLLTSFTDPRLLRTSLDTIPAGMLYLVKQSIDDLSMLA